MIRPYPYESIQGKESYYSFKFAVGSLFVVLSSSLCRSLFVALSISHRRSVTLSFALLLSPSLCHSLSFALTHTLSMLLVDVVNASLPPKEANLPMGALLPPKEANLFKFIVVSSHSQRCLSLLYILLNLLRCL
jgi:hypothetical protein